MHKFDRGLNEHNGCYYYTDYRFSADQQERLRARLRQLGELASFTVGDRGPDVTKKSGFAWSDVHSKVRAAMDVVRG